MMRHCPRKQQVLGLMLASLSSLWACAETPPNQTGASPRPSSTPPERTLPPDQDEVSADQLYQQALQETQQKDFEAAIAHLQTASGLYTQQDQPIEAYKSQALIMHLQSSQEQQESLAEEGWTSPEWLRFSSCLGSGETLCNYSLSGIRPEPPADLENQVGGVLILEKEVDRVDLPAGGSVPVQAIMDAQVVQPVQSDEALLSICQRQGKSDPNVVAIAQIEGYEDQEFYTEVRQAWRANLETEQIEAITTETVACVNQCPGGC